MSSQNRFRSMWQLFALSATVLLYTGAFHSVLSQVPNLTGSIARIDRAPNPQTNHALRKRPDNRVKQTSSGLPQPSTNTDLDAKHEELERAIEAGNKARDENDYERALASYRRVAEGLDPKEPRAFYGLGNVYSDLACSDKAIGAYRDALRLKKDFREALIGLGYAFAGKERYDEAETEFRKVFTNNPNDTGANIGLGFLSGKRKKHQDAIKQLTLITGNQSIEGKDRAIAHVVLGDIYVEQKKWPDAASEYKEAISLSADLAVAYIKLGQAELYPASSRFSTLEIREIRTEDRERLIKAARRAAQNIRMAIDERGYKHPFGDLLLGYALMDQFSYQDAASNINAYLGKVKGLENRSAFLAAKCDQGFNRLYAFGYLALALLYDRQRLLESDDQKTPDLFNKAIANINQVIQLTPDDAQAYGMLGHIYLQQGKYPEAREQLENAIARETNEVSKAWDYAGIAWVYLRIGRTADAIDSLNRAIKLQPDIPVYYSSLALIHKNQGNFDEAIKLEKEAIALQHESNASSYWSLATHYFARARQKNSEADYEEAIKLLNKAIGINRSYSRAYMLLGHVYKFYKGGAEADKALANYEEAAKYDPKEPAIYFHIGDLYFAVKHNDEAAIKYLKEAIKLNPDYAQAYVELGQVYRHKHDDAEATKQLLEAIRSDGKYLDAYVALIDIYKSQKNYAEAIKCLNRVLEIAPQEFYAYKELAKVYEAQHKSEDAIRYYQQAITLLKPEDTFGRDLYLCRVERLRGHYADAIGCFQSLKPLSSEDPGQQAYDIGLTYVASKNKKAALAQYEQLKQLKSSLAEDLLGQIKDMK